MSELLLFLHYHFRYNVDLDLTSRSMVSDLGLYILPVPLMERLA